MVVEPYTLSDLEHDALAKAIAKTVRDFEYYYGTVGDTGRLEDKLEEWIRDTIRKFYNER